MQTPTSVVALLVATNAVTFLVATRRESPPPPPQEIRIVQVPVDRSDPKEVESLRKDLDTATRRLEIAAGQSSRLQQLQKSLEKDVKDIRQSYAEARKDLKEKETVFAMLEEHGVDVRTLLLGPPVPALNSTVSAVKTDVQPALVLLSIGSDRGVEKGFLFSIYRGSELVGKVVVEKLLKDSCGCRVLFARAGTSVQAGDSAATWLP